MSLDEVYSRLLFLINKAQGGWYSPEELDDIVDSAQMTLFNRYYIEYATSQRLIDALGPFKTQVSGTTGSNGLISIGSQYMDLLALYTLVQDPDNVTRAKPVPIIKEDELAFRLSSQISPPTISAPVARLLAGNIIQLYPQVAHTHITMYLRRPAAPHFGYTLVSGRVIVYDPLTSTQLEWSDKDIKSIILIALEELGLNLSEAETVQWAASKDAQNFNSNMKE